ncbi:hypothetical protein Tco_1038923, partial [Tanacetum coccineum]
ARNQKVGEKPLLSVANFVQSGHGKLTREMTRLMASFDHMASIGIQYIGQRPIFNSLFIYSAELRIAQALMIRLKLSKMWELTSVISPEVVNCDDKIKELNVGPMAHSLLKD